MASKGAQILGVNEYAGKVAKLIKLSKKELARSLVTTTLTILNEMQQNVPVGETGNLKASLASEEDTKALEAIVFSETEYAPFVEFGTVNMAAQPFFQPAVRNNIGVWTASVQKAINNAYLLT